MIAPTPDPTDRLFAPFRRMVLACLPSIKFFGTWEYAAVGTAGPTLTGRCTDAAAGMPDLTNVSMLQATGGGAATWLQSGTTFLVAFANQDPGRPVVISGPPSGIPATATVDASVSVAIGPSAASVALAGGTFPIALAPIVDSFIAVLIAWTPVPLDGGLALKTAITAWIASTLYTTTGSTKSKSA